MQKYDEQKAELEALEKELTELRIETAALKTKGPKVEVEELRKNLANKQEELEELNEAYEALKQSEADTAKALEELQKRSEGE